jgi:uncharacterized membrane protein YeaQ/YmgE (transglycosylase-associated protein family)
MLTMSWPALIVLMLIAVACATLARAIAPRKAGLVTSTSLSFIGALFGPWLAHQLNLSEPLIVRVGGRPFPIVWSILGAAVFVAALHVLSRRRSLLRL